MKNGGQTFSGVYPVLPTPFNADGTPDRAALRTLVRYLLASGVDGMTYPGVASEVSTLSEQERLELTLLVLSEVAGHVPVIAGVSSGDLDITRRLAGAVHAAGASMVMAAAPAGLNSAADQVEYFRALASEVPGLPIMLQNVPPPVGAGLEPEVLAGILNAVPSVEYVKEEALPSGQRLTKLLSLAPDSLRGVFGGAGGRYITDELRRGACGTMPAIELAEVHVALFAAHRQGQGPEVRRIFMRMLPVLNIQAIFRWSLTKSVLKRRGLISSAFQRTPGPRMDDLDQQDAQSFFDDLHDLLLPDSTIKKCLISTNKEEVTHGAA